MAQQIKFTWAGERSKITRERKVGRKPMKFVEGRFEKAKRDKTGRELAYESLLRELKKDDIGFSDAAANEVAKRAANIATIQYMHMKTLAVALAIYNQMVNPQRIRDAIPLDPEFLDMKEEMIYDVAPHVDALLLNNKDFLQYVTDNDIDVESPLYTLLYSIRVMNSHIDRYIEYLTREPPGRGKAEKAQEDTHSLEEKVRRNRAEVLAYLRVILLSQKRFQGDIATYTLEEQEE